MSYFKVLSMTPDCFRRFCRGRPALLKPEALITNLAFALRYVSALLFLLGMACYSGVTTAPEPLATTALTVGALATQLIAFVLCMWLIYRLSTQASESEFNWCEDRFHAIGMHAPFRHMNRYVLASYVSAEANCRMRPQAQVLPDQFFE